MKSVHVIVHGLVQGVYYRQSTKEHADRLGLKGWVRNLPGGTVEVEAEGEVAAVHAFLEWCRRGPQHAKVTHTDIHEQPLKNFTSFEIRR